MKTIYSLLITDINGSLRPVTFEHKQDRNDMFNWMLEAHMKRGMKEVSQHDDLYILHTPEGKVRMQLCESALY